jgi:hypothetical protein
MLQPHKTETPALPPRYLVPVEVQPILFHPRAVRPFSQNPNVLFSPCDDDPREDTMLDSYALQRSPETRPAFPTLDNCAPESDASNSTEPYDSAPMHSDHCTSLYRSPTFANQDHFNRLTSPGPPQQDPIPYATAGPTFRPHRNLTPLPWIGWLPDAEFNASGNWQTFVDEPATIQNGMPFVNSQNSPFSTTDPVPQIAPLPASSPQNFNGNSTPGHMERVLISEEAYLESSPPFSQGARPCHDWEALSDPFTTQGIHDVSFIYSATTIRISTAQSFMYTSFSPSTGQLRGVSPERLISADSGSRGETSEERQPGEGSLDQRKVFSLWDAGHGLFQSAEGSETTDHAAEESM